MKEAVVMQINFLPFTALETLKHLLLPCMCLCSSVK